MTLSLHEKRQSGLPAPRQKFSSHQHLRVQVTFTSPTVVDDVGAVYHYYFSNYQNDPRRMTQRVNEAPGARSARVIHVGWWTWHCIHQYYTSRCTYYNTISGQ